MDGLRKKTILLVEDEAILAMSEKLLLEKYGYAVTTASSGEKAIERFSADPGIDLVLMDIDLGSGMDGTQAAQSLLGIRSVPVVFLSSHTEQEVVEKTERITSYGYVVKNSGITVLDASIKMAFKLFDANEKSRRELEERIRAEERRDMELRFTNALNELAELIIGAEEPGRLLAESNRIVSRVLGLDRALIYDVSFPEDRITALCEALGLEHPDIEPTKGGYTSLAMFAEAFSRIRDTRAPVISYDSDVAPCFRDGVQEALLHGRLKIRSLLWYPFAFDEHGYYLFTLNRILDGRPWSQEELGFMASVARQMSIAIMKIKFLEERKRAAAAFESKHILLENIINSSPDYIYVKDRELRIVTCNRIFAAALGKTPSELVGKSDLECGWDPDFVLGNPAKGIRGFREDDLAALTGRTVTIGSEPGNVSGAVRLFETVKLPLKDQSGRIFGILGLSRDVTESRRNEARMRRLLDILQQPSDSVQGFLDYALDQAIDLTGSRYGYIYHYDEESQALTLNTWSKGVMPDCAVAEAGTRYELLKTGLWGEAVRQRRPVVVNDFRAPNPLKKGYPAGHVELRRFMTLPIFQDGRIIGVVGLADKEQDYDDNDVLQISLLMDSVWKAVDRLNAELESKRLLREKETILKEVNHRVKNLMSAIHGVLLFQSATSKDPSVSTVLAEAGGRVRSMMLLYGKLYEAANFKALSIDSYLSTIVDEVLAIYPAGARVVVTREITDEVLEAKRLQILGIVVNELLTNAMKYAFTPERGGRLEVLVRREGGSLRVEVADDGPGIPDSVDADHGSGFGLSLVSGLAEQLSGTLRIERAGEGISRGSRVILEFKA